MFDPSDDEILQKSMGNFITSWSKKFLLVKLFVFLLFSYVIAK